MVKILIADNSSVVRERLVALLQKSEGSAIIVNQAINAVEMITSVEMLMPDVVIFDIHISGNGYKALQAIKKKDHPPVVIIYTNYFESPIEKKCLELGADYFFNKWAGLQKMQILLKQLISDFKTG